MPRRRLAASRALSLTVTTLALAAVAAAPAAAAGTDAGRLATATNHARADHRLRHYAVKRDLNAVAHRWAARMAAHHTLAHNPNLRRDVHGWQQVGENVGVGPTAARIESAFMHSSPHRANILSRSFLQVGVGTARDSQGQLYVDVVFRRPS